MPNAFMVFVTFALTSALPGFAQTQSQRPLFKSATHLNTVTVTVLHQGGKTIRGLPAEAFEISYPAESAPGEKKISEPAFFSESKQNRLPIDLTVLVDGSKSMEKELGRARTGVKELLSYLGQDDRGRIIRFDKVADLSQELTPSRKMLDTKLNAIKADGTTESLSALLATVRKLQSEQSAKERRQPVMVMVTDGGEDEGVMTDHYYDKLTQSIELTKAPLYVISSGHNWRLARLASKSGGEFYRAYSDESGSLKAAARKIGDELTSKYELSFHSEKPVPLGDISVNIPSLPHSWTKISKSDDIPTEKPAEATEDELLSAIRAASEAGKTINEILGANCCKLPDEQPVRKKIPVTFPCKFNKENPLPQLYLYGDHHTSESDQKAIRSFADRALNGEIYVGVEAVAIGEDPGSRFGGPALARPGSNLFGYEDPYAIGLSHFMMMGFGLKSQDPQTVLAQKIRLMTEPARTSLAREAWKRVQRPIPDATAERIARLIDLNLQGALTADYLKKIVEKGLVGGSDAFTQLLKSYLSSYYDLQSSKTAESLPVRPAKEVFLNAVGEREGSAPYDLWAREAEIRWRTEMFANNVAALYCAAARDGKNLVITTGAGHVTPLAELVAPNAPVKIQWLNPRM